MKATYDLSRYPASFNFVEFLVAASTRGADHIVFAGNENRLHKYPDHVIEGRIKSILEPACALAGCSFGYGKPEGIDPGYHISAVLKAFNEIGHIKKLVSVLPAKHEKYTVTIRNYGRHSERNSSPVWREFAKEIGAFVIEDFSDKPIGLHERMAYYAGAEMNYFVPNGPLSLCLFSGYPYTAFLKNVNRNYHKEHGWYKKDVPWANDNQRVFWCDDTLENIRASLDNRR